MISLLAAEANRHFSSLWREVAQGEAVTVLAHGKPVTTISSVTRQDHDGLDVQTALLIRLRRQTPSGSREWRRDDLYD
jgi:antitoxin (DNA-binding transcriptional repressor) of toxin-antitoxin stability system